VDKVKTIKMGQIYFIKNAIKMGQIYFNKKGEDLPPPFPFSTPSTAVRFGTTLQPYPEHY
jgi:hypothetical protein